MRRKYTPRKAGKRWLEEAPSYVLDCFDNKGQTADRYTVIFGKEFMETDARGDWIALLDMSPEPTHPQGVGVSASYLAHEIAAFRYRSGHHRVKWADLPDAVKRCVRCWAEESTPGGEA